jgi:hypothetical protein
MPTRRSTPSVTVGEASVFVEKILKQGRNANMEKRKPSTSKETSSPAATEILARALENQAKGESSEINRNRKMKGANILREKMAVLRS